MRTVAVLGPIPRDRITTHRGEVFEKYGCVLYSVAALSALMEPTDRICPIVHVRKQDEKAIKDLLAPMPNVDLTGVRSDTDRGDVVQLTYKDQRTRLEHQTGFMSPILPRDVEFALDAEAFVCVPITDYEVGQATLEYIRANSDGVVLLDGHGPVSTLTIGGERQHRLWAERDAWLPSIDILKMNLEEAGCSWFPRESEDGGATMGQPMTEDEMPRFAEHCLRHGVQAVCVTLDEQGCVAYRLGGDGELEEHVVPRVPVENVVDTTGCGDSFAAGMAFGYLLGRDIVKACQYGNAMGAQRCAGSELSIYLPRVETDAQIERTYGPMAERHVREALSSPEWLITEDGFDPERANVRETLCTVGNGYLGTRGTLEEGHLGDLSGTYLAGVYDAHDSPVVDLVNAPDWLSFAVYVDGTRLDVRNAAVLDHERTLDLRTGLLYRRTVFEDADGRRTRLETLRCASVADRRTCALRVEITPVNHEGEITVESALDGRRRNLERLPVYPAGTAFPSETRWEKWALTRHLDRTERTAVGDVAYLEMRTIASGITLGYAATTLPSVDPTWSGFTAEDERVIWRAVFPGGPVRLDKLVRIGTSRDVDGGPVKEGCLDGLDAARAQGFDAIVAASAAAWEERWDDCDVTIDGDPASTQAMRFGVYHLLIAANDADPTVNIGAKSLSGEGYRGHVFWDTEILMLPFFIYTRPEAARSLLAYRHHTLPGARENARINGSAGARYPWESADTGLEECPEFTPDGTNRFWTREEEVHINADVARGVMQYVEATGDRTFLLERGAAILFETSRFWADRVEWTETGTCSLRRVMGPDEFHSHVDDNAFTNYLVRWHLETAADVHDQLRTEQPEVAAALGLTDAEVDRWRAVAAAIALPPQRPDRLIEQFAGYFDRLDVPVTEWDENDMPRYPAGYHHFNCEDTQLLKQPDVLMALYLLPDVFDAATTRANFEYYEARTLHKSSLSPSIHAIMGIEVGDPSRAEQYFARSAFVDLTDNQGNTAEGMHIASAGGTWQVLVCGFGGFRVVHGQMSFRPWLPESWQAIHFRLRWREARLRVTVDHAGITFDVDGLDGLGGGEGLPVLVHGRPVELTTGTTTVPHEAVPVG